MSVSTAGATRVSRLPAVLLGLSLAAVGALGVWSRDFGHHWDEGKLTKSVQLSFELGLMLPHWYNYPSLAYDVAILTALPRALPDAVRHFEPNDPRTGSAELLKHLGSKTFLLQLRSVFFVLCTLTGLAVFLLARRLTGDDWAALFAALATVTSWEFFYHSRWIAPDGLVMVFAAFSLWAQSRVLQSCVPSGRNRRVAWAAFLAGLAAAAKYTGGIALLSLLLAVALAPRERGAVRFARLRESALALLVATLTFLVTTPGALLEPALFVRGLAEEATHYRFGHGGHSVEAGWQHLSLLATYLGTVLLSRQPVLAALVALLAIAGAVDLARRQPRVAIWLLGLPVVFVAFISTNRVMIVRNDLILLPPLAALAGAGFAALRRMTAGTRAMRFAAGALAALLVGFNFAGIAGAARSIVSPNRTDAGQALERRIRSDPEVRFFLSPFVRFGLRDSSVLGEANVVGVMDSADRFIFWSYDLTGWDQLTANRAGRYRTVWQYVDEVNWDYYPDWGGHRRLLELPARGLKMN